MLRRGFRLTSLARLAAARHFPAALPPPPPSALPAISRQPSQLIPHDFKLFGLPRCFATVATTPSGSHAISEEMEAEIDHATGLEKEELLGEVEGKPRFDLSPPVGPFGTAEAPAIIDSYYDERLVGCSGGIGEEEHDVVWFHLKKDVGHECSVCGQVFQLKVIGEGGPPGGHH